MLNLTQTDVIFAVIVGALVGIIFALKYLIRLEQKILNVEVHVEHLVDQLRYNELSILDEEYKIGKKLGVNSKKSSPKRATRKSVKKTTKKSAKKVVKRKVRKPVKRRR